MGPERIKELREAAARHDDSDLSCWGIDECLDEIERLTAASESYRGLAVQLENQVAAERRDLERLRKALEIIELNTRKPAAFDGDYNQIHGVAEDALR